MSGASVPLGQMAGVPPLAPPEHPKAPEFACDGQKIPPALKKKAVPVVIGFKFTGKAGSTVATGGLQSWLFPVVLTGVHAMPSSGDGPAPDVQPTWQVPVGVPTVPPVQSGHGKALLAVRYTVELSGKLPLNTPPKVVSVPVAGDAKVLRTQV